MNTCLRQTLLREWPSVPTKVLTSTPQFLLPCFTLSVRSSRIASQLRHQSTTPTIAKASSTPPTPSTAPTSPEHAQENITSSLPSALPSSKRVKPLPPPILSIPTHLPSLILQPPHYLTIHIHARPYLVTLGDTITLPALLYGPDATKPLRPGDLLRITHASTIGSRDYTIKGAPYVDENLFLCKARVVETTSEPMRFKEKTKRRQRRVKTVKSKHKYTVLRICELEVKGVPQEDSTSAV